MAYRTIKKPKRQKRVLQGVATENVTVAKNGAILNLAIPCWYYEVDHPQHTHIHDKEWHDHVGWPNPDSRDCSCQDTTYAELFSVDGRLLGWRRDKRYLDLSKCFPIHLIKEGYTSIDVAFSEPIEGLSASGTIDQKEDHVVRILIKPQCPNAINEDIEIDYTVFANGHLGDREARDVVATGKLRILAGPYRQENQ